MSHIMDIVSLSHDVCMLNDMFSRIHVGSAWADHNDTTARSQSSGFFGLARSGADKNDN